MNWSEAHEDAARDAAAMLKALIQEDGQALLAVQKECDPAMTLQAMTTLAEVFLAEAVGMDKKKALERLERWQRGDGFVADI